MNKHRVYLSLGGNQDQPLIRLKRALTCLSQNQAVVHLKCSHFYWTEPLYFHSLHWFVNAACSFDTSLSLSDVFLMTQEIETMLGKNEKPKNADRLIDIDLLFYGGKIGGDSALEIPHPRWKERLFVLQPLSDLTDVICLDAETGQEHYDINNLKHELIAKGHKSVSLLEKNPYLQ